MTNDINNDIKVLIGKITEIRKTAGLSQRQLEEMTGLKQSVIARMELGLTTPKLITVFKILSALNYTLEVKPK